MNGLIGRLKAGSTGTLGRLATSGWVGWGLVARKRPVGNRPVRKIRTGMGEGEEAGWVGLGAGKGGSTRSLRQAQGRLSGDSRPAHHERGGWVMQVARKRPVGNRPLRKQGVVARASRPEDGRVSDRAPTQDLDGDWGGGGRRVGWGWVLGGVVRHGQPKTAVRLTMNGGWLMQDARKRPVGNRPVRKQGVVARASRPEDGRV